MKNYLTTLLILLGLGTAASQHTRPITTKQITKVVKVETHKKPMPAVARKGNKVQTVSANSNVASTTVRTKKDGTPDRRYKANQHLKKDGTPDRRYKASK